MEQQQSNDIQTPINNRQYFTRNEQLFPYINDKDKINKLLIDDESLMYISRRTDAMTITTIICDHLKQIDMIAYDTTLVDMTAGVGGNTLSFCDKFKKVYAIELDETRVKYLENNINIYGFRNATVIHDDSLKHVATMIPGSFDICFIDPPWGGKHYKEIQDMKLTLSDVSIETVIEIIFTQQNPRLVCIKLPKNYDIYYFYCKLRQYKIFMYTLDKMLIMIIENNKIIKQMFSLKNNL